MFQDSAGADLCAHAELLQDLFAHSKSYWRCRKQLRARRASTNDSNSFQVRIDHHFSDNDTIFFRYTQQNVSVFNPSATVAPLAAAAKVATMAVRGLTLLVPI
jgi:hypothetical protein